MNLRPLSTKIVIELIEKDTVSAGGIILTKADASEASRATVLAIGPDVVDVQVGDIILPNWKTAKKTSEGIYIVQEEDVVAVFVEA